MTPTGRKPGGALVSNVEVLRKFVYENGPVTKDDMVRAIRAHMHGVLSDEEALNNYVLPVLKTQSYYRESEGRYTVVEEMIPEYAAVVEILEGERRLLLERELRSRLSRRLGLRYDDVVIDFKRHPKLKRSGTRWGLDGWEIINDQAYEVLKDRGVPMTERDIVNAVCERFDRSHATSIFDPERDKRFVRDRKAWTLAQEKPPRAKGVQRALKLDVTKRVDKSFEESFVEAFNPKEQGRTDKAAAKPSLKKVLRKKIEEKVEQVRAAKEQMGRTILLGGPQKPSAAPVGQQAKAVEEVSYSVKSFQAVEPSIREHSLSQKQKDEMSDFLERLPPTAGGLAKIGVKMPGALSPAKISETLAQKYDGYASDRVVIPHEYNKLLVEIASPRLDEIILNPACHAGDLAIAIIDHVFDSLKNSKWALSEDDTIEVALSSGETLTIYASDTKLLEKAADKFMVSQSDLIDHFLSFSFCAIEKDGVLARAARFKCMLSGHDLAYVVSRDYFTELPAVFGQEPNEDNEITLRFDLIAGNFTFVGSHNTVANYIDQSIRILDSDGRLVMFLPDSFLSVLKTHSFLKQVQDACDFRYIFNLPHFESGEPVSLVCLQKRNEDEPPPDVVVAQFKNYNDALVAVGALKAGEMKEGLMFSFDQTRVPDVLD